MDNSRKNTRYSIDGFMPNSQGRQVGFGSSNEKIGTNFNRVRMRRPGLHHDPSKPVVSPLERPKLAQPMHSQTTANPQGTGRKNFPEFTTYRSANQPPKHDLGGRTRRHQEKRLRGEKKGSFFKRVSWKKVIKRSALVLGVLVVLCAGWLGWKLMRDTSKAFGGNLVGFLSATPLKGEQQGRVNILLAGDSADDPGHQGADLTDSIMLLSIDTKNNKAFMLSIPRDLWVNLPDSMGHEKINAANTDTNFSMAGYPKGGMGALEYVVSQNFGIPIDYYALINYTAYRDAVNAVGGVTVTINSPDPRGLYDPNTNTRLPNGQVSLNGTTALNLARSRGDGPGSYGFPGSDFDRTQYQREIGLAIKSKLFSTSTLANPLKLGQLFDAFGNNISTDLTTGNVHRLYDVFNKISNSSIQSIGLNSYNNVDYFANYSAANGESALIPAAGLDDFSQLQSILKKLTSNSQVVKESANVVVLNGGNLTGLAAKEGNILTGKGMDVTTTTDAPSTYNNNTIIDQSSGKDPATLSTLEQLFGNTTTTSPPSGVSYPSANFIVILGTNQEMPTD